MTAKPASNFADWLMCFVVGPELGEAVSGDLQEQAAQTKAPRLSYSMAYVRSLPGLVRLGAGDVSMTRLGKEMSIALLALSLTWIWEVSVAQVYAWPIAANLYEMSPLSVAATCKLAYLCLFGLGVAGLLSGWAVLNAATQSPWRLRTQRFATWGIAGLVPVVYLLANPGPYDGSPVFRYVQIAIIALMGALAIFRFRSEFQPA